MALGRDDHALLLTMHHIVSDGWSVGILLEELGALYAAYSAEQPSPLQPLELQYGDFSVWQRQWLTDEVLDRQLAYWKPQLDGISDLRLPTDRPRPAVESFRGAIEPFEWDPELSTSLQRFSNDERVTVFMTLLAVFQGLLARYSGQTDICVGSQIANRRRVELERLIGVFVNTIVLRTNLAGRPTFREIVQRVRDVCLGAYAHQDLPFEKLVEALQPERDLTRQPLFQVGFAFQNAPPPDVTSTEHLTLSPMQVDCGTSRFDLDLLIWNQGDRFSGYMEFSTDLFDAATIRRLLSHFQALLRAAIADPDRRFAELPLLTEPEQRLLSDWNCSKSKVAGLFPELFQAQVARTPDSVAVVADQGQLTYAELDRRTSELAHYLSARGIGRGAFVGLFADRSIEVILGLLGILKAGGTYVPLATDNPHERLEMLVQDARPAVVLHG